jgi:phenylacetate-CoA ligase
MSTDELPALLSELSPFYRERLGAAAPRELARLPLTRRDELVRDQLVHLPLGTRRQPAAGSPVRVGVTGSGETLLVLAWSAAELARERAAGARLLSRLGVRAGVRVANTLPGALATPGALLLGDVVEEIGALDVPLGAIEGEAAAGAAWELFERVQPELLVLDPASASPFFAAARAAQRGWWKGIIWLGSPTSALPPAAGFAGWQRAWLAVPEATSFVAGSCAHGRHHPDDALVVEVVDERTGAPLPSGQPGTLALTPLGRETPLLRYASGVTGRRVPEPCRCGHPGFVFELV